MSSPPVTSPSSPPAPENRPGVLGREIIAARI
jgi:hypothetical protein